MMNCQSIRSLLIILLIDTEIVQCILNGNTTVGDHFKYQVIIWDKSFNTCSGAIIDDLHILTAGHCIHHSPADEYFVFAHITDLVVQKPIICKVKTIHVHPNFTTAYEPNERDLTEKIPYHSENDIAILTLTERLDLNEQVAAIPLPIETISPCEMIDFCEIAGWGESVSDPSISPKLLWANINVYGSALCRIFGTPVRDNEFCGMDPNGIRTLAKGDSGGGLVCNGILVGVASGSAQDPQRPSVYANLYYFLSFITEVRTIDQENTEP